MDYKKGKYTITKDYFDPEVCEDDFIINLILSMIDIDPKKRKKIDQYLHMFIYQSEDEACKAFPETFHKVFYPLGCSFLLPEYLMADEQIALIYDNFSQVHSDDNFELTNPLNPMIFQKVRGRNNFYLRHDKHKHKLPLSEVIEEHPEEEKGIQSPKKKAKSDEGLILFHMLANIIPYTRYPSTRI